VDRPYSLVQAEGSTVFDPLESGEQLKSQQMAEGKGNLALPVAINVVLLDFHVSAVTQYSLNHGGK